ncbi:hypothetical protein DV735_g2409, partial [Chaetothyriales sp. CBS 134920]
MAKTAKPKRSNVAANPRSRAAKRDTSPSLNTDKSLKEVGRADIGPILHSRQNAAGAIKKKKTAPLKRGQRARQERGLARAEAVMDQLEKKVEGARNRVKKRKDRSAQWEEVNAASVEEQRKAPKLAFGGLLEGIEGGGGGDGDDGADGADGADAPSRDVDLEMKTIDEIPDAVVPPEEEDEIT